MAVGLIAAAWRAPEALAQVLPLEIRQDSTRYNLGSTNGLTVNGRRQQRAQLQNEDRITVGSTDLVFRRSPGAEV